VVAVSRRLDLIGSKLWEKSLEFQSSEGNSFPNFICRFDFIFALQMGQK
jgi:hypothetical protein